MKPLGSVLKSHPRVATSSSPSTSRIERPTQYGIARVALFPWSECGTSIFVACARWKTYAASDTFKRGEHIPTTAIRVSVGPPEAGDEMLPHVPGEAERCALKVRR